MNNTKQDLVILVDENDNETGTMEKLEAHKKGVLHRAISVFIINSKGQWLVHRRASNKYHSNGLWTNACCSHPFPGETCHQAANRRLMEEMGINAPLKEIFQFTYKAELDNELTEHELDHVFFGISDEKPMINKKEVQDWKYVSFQQLLEDINKMPEKYTFWFKKIFERVNRHILSYSSEQKIES